MKNGHYAMYHKKEKKRRMRRPDSECGDEGGRREKL